MGVGDELVEHGQRRPGEAVVAAPIANIWAIVRSTSMPTSAALSRLAEHARMARPRKVPLSSAYRPASSTTATDAGVQLGACGTTSAPSSKDLLKYDGVAAARLGAPQTATARRRPPTATPNDATSVSSGSIRWTRAMTVL